MNKKDKTEILKTLYDMKHDWTIWIHFDKPFETDMYKNIQRLIDLNSKKSKPIRRLIIGAK